MKFENRILMKPVRFVKNSSCNLIVDKEMLRADDRLLMCLMGFLLLVLTLLIGYVALSIFADETM
ncbi:hypothetical protein [Sphingobacterium bambusae]|uniref:Uncharacterized protein n=1 Tax=Sphingobacterium bambusae TaxID=662858 RepID=A0ABW6BE28_9SPHI|nr:hypothetical protein [Sphingobacterium bambusae]WPL47511.1 hypothetical protein SCB77_16275 [Sphingobacterium bambusae]